jgi:hypothetical protein
VERGVKGEGRGGSVSSREGMKGVNTAVDETQEGKGLQVTYLPSHPYRSQC